MSSNKTSRPLILRSPRCSPYQNHNNHMHRAAAQSKRGNTIKMWVVYSTLVCFNSDGKAGCCSAAREASRRRDELQGSPRSTDEESTSLKIPHRELRLISVRPFSAAFKPPAICVATLSHSYKFGDTPTRLPELEP